MTTGPRSKCPRSLRGPVKGPDLFQKGDGVQVFISGHHYTVSDRTKTYVETETEKLEKFYSPVIDVHTTITEEGKRHKVDLVVNIHARTLKSSGEDEKIYPAIDQAVNRMISQLKKVHDKQRDHRSEKRNELSIGG